MKQKYAVVILLGLIALSGLTSLNSFRATERIVAEDMECALNKALAEQQSDVISSDTIRTFNNYLKMEQLRGHAVLAVTTRQNGLRCEAKCSAATIFSLSDQRPASILWTMALLWGLYCFWRYRKQVPLVAFGGLAYSRRPILRCEGQASQVDTHAAATDGNVLPQRVAPTDEN